MNDNIRLGVAAGLAALFVAVLVQQRGPLRRYLRIEKM
jgi:hypothetical protein